MCKKGLKPFRVCHLTRCPECGATGDYELLKDAAIVVKQKLDAYLRANPQESGLDRGPLADLKAAVGVLHSVIDKE